MEKDTIDTTDSVANPKSRQELAIKIATVLFKAMIWLTKISFRLASQMARGLAFGIMRLR